MKNILIVNSTFRRGGNTELLAKQFAKGAEEAGNRVKTISLRELKLQFCIGCLACLDSGKCVLDDSVNSHLLEVREADVLVFATPVYYYSMSGQLKTFLDRLNPLYGQENKFKEVYLLTAAAENDRSAMDGTVKGVQGWVDCFDGARLAGVVYGIGADAVGSIKDTAAYEEAYRMGRSVH